MPIVYGSADRSGGGVRISHLKEIAGFVCGAVRFSTFLQASLSWRLLLSQGCRFYGGLRERGLRTPEHVFCGIFRSPPVPRISVFSAMPFTCSGCENSVGCIVNGTCHKSERNTPLHPRGRPLSRQPPFTGITLSGDKAKKCGLPLSNPH